MAATAGQSAVVFTETGATYTVGNGNVVHYRKVNGVFYHVEAPAAGIDALETARSRRQRVRLYYGNPETGKDWLKEHNIEGYIGNSTGPLKVPPLICNRRSLGGFALLDHRIIKIRWTSGGILYQHPGYHTGTLTIRLIGPDEMSGGKNLRGLGYTHAVDRDNSNQACFRSAREAERYVQRMRT